MILDAVISLTSLVAPLVFDFVKKKWLKPGSDSPEATMSSLAMTGKSEVLPGYVEALAKYQDAQTRWFNRDINGELWSVTVNLRALIRPCGIIVSMLHLVLSAKGYASPVEPGLRYFYETIIGSWFGARLTKE